IGSVYSDNFGRDLHIAALPVTGTYTIMVAPHGNYSGAKPITLSQDLVVGPITIGGASVPVNLTRPGQRAKVTFAGTAGQRLNMAATNATIQVTLTTLKPDGSVWGASTVSNNSVTDYVLPTTGTYTLVLDGPPSTAGTMTLTLSTEIGGSITMGGPPVTVSLTRPGQKARLTYSGTELQRVSLN